MFSFPFVVLVASHLYFKGGNLPVPGRCFPFTLGQALIPLIQLDCSIVSVKNS